MLQKQSPNIKFTEMMIHKFFCALVKTPEYDQLGKLALELLCMSPDTVDCECGFSHMNLTKNQACFSKLSGKPTSTDDCLHERSNT